MPCVEAINRYYGRADLPIGAPKSSWRDTGERGSSYAKQISEQFETQLKSNDGAPNTVDVDRRVLAAQPEGSVVVLTVGYLTNLRDLLASKPDSAGPIRRCTGAKKGKTLGLHGRPLSEKHGTGQLGEISGPTRRLP